MAAPAERIVPARIVLGPFGAAYGGFGQCRAHRVPKSAAPPRMFLSGERHWSVVGFRRVAAVGRGASVGKGTQLSLVASAVQSERRGTKGRQTALTLRSDSPLHSSSHCSRRFGASRSLRSLDPATSDGWCCAHAGACSGRSALPANRLTCMPTQTTRSQIDRKVNFAIRLLREAAELLQASSGTTSTQGPRYPRRPIERDE